MDFWLAGSARQPRRGQQRITDHMHHQHKGREANDVHDRTRVEDPTERPTGLQRHEELNDTFIIGWRRQIQTQTTIMNYFGHKQR